MRELRRMRGLTQAELAARAGVSRAEVSAIETGRVRPSVDAALAIAGALGVTVEAAFGAGSGDPPGLAWDPPAGTSRVWLAEVGGRRLLYPSEPTGAGTVPHDGTLDARAAHIREDVDPSRTLILAGCDPAVGILRDTLLVAGINVVPLVRSSGKALELLGAGLVHVAGVHLTDGRGRPANRRVARERLGPGFRLVRVARWNEGVALREGGVRSVRAVVDRTHSWVGREEGSGARMCLDRLLGTSGARRRKILEASDHRAVAGAIRDGWADAGVCVQLAADEAHLHFLSVQREAYDLCFRAEDEDDPRIVALLAAIRSYELRSRLNELPGYDARGAGDVEDVA